MIEILHFQEDMIKLINLDTRQSLVFCTLTLIKLSILKAKEARKRIY